MTNSPTIKSSDERFSPFFRNPRQPRQVIAPNLAAAAALLLPAALIYGFRVIIVAILGACGGFAAEAVWRLARRQAPGAGDLSSIYSGVLCACMLPPSAPVWLPLVAAVFAATVIKLAFGGLGRTPFNPAAGGFCFAAMIGGCMKSSINAMQLTGMDKQVWDGLPARFFVYIRSHGVLPLIADIPYGQGEPLADILDPLTLLRAGVDPKLNFADFFFFDMNGSIGGIAVLLAIAAGVWLFYRKAFAHGAAAAFCVPFVILSFLFPYKAVGHFLSPVYDLCCGGTMMLAVLICGDIFTAPHLRGGRVIYGLTAGTLAFILRRTGAVSGGEAFALLLMNAFSNQIDRLAWRLNRRGVSWAGVRNRLAARRAGKRGASGQGEGRDDDAVTI